MRTPSPPNCRLDLAPPLADRFIVGAAPSITARYFSSCPSDSISRWTPCPPQNQPRPCGQRGITLAFGYGPPHLRARGTSTLLNNALLSAQYAFFDCMRRAVQDTPPAKRRPAEIHRPASMSEGKAGLDQSSELLSWKSAHLTNSASDQQH